MKFFLEVWEAYHVSQKILHHVDFCIGSTRVYPEPVTYRGSRHPHEPNRPDLGYHSPISLPNSAEQGWGNMAIPLILGDTHKSMAISGINGVIWY